MMFKISELYKIYGLVCVFKTHAWVPAVAASDI